MIILPIDLETEFGQSKVDVSVKLLAQKTPENPAPTLGYLNGTAQNLK